MKLFHESIKMEAKLTESNIQKKSEFKGNVNPM